MQIDIQQNYDEVDFKLPCSTEMWQRFIEYKKRLQDSKSYSPSLYWKQREESFNVRYEKGYVYLSGLYKRDLTKEMSIGNIIQKLNTHFEIYYRAFLRKVFFKKSRPPSPLMNTKEDYIKKRKETYNKNYKTIVSSLLGEYYDLEHEDVYAKHMDIINCLEKYINRSKRNNFVEIGSGSGVLAFLVVERLGFKKANLIDLPIMIPVCYFWLSSLAGENAVALPGEKYSDEIIYRLWNAGDIDLENNSNDLALNITSFQEMNHKLVKDYFQIINRCLKPKSYFMCVNRWSKATDFWLYPFKIFKNSKTILFDEDLTSRHSSMNKIIVKKLIQLEDNN